MTARTGHREKLRRTRWGFAVLASALITAALLSIATPSQAQIGCCYCDNCPPAVGPLCTDLMNSSASCVDLCIVQRGCAVLEFSPSDTCDQGCGSKPPFFSPTPTATPTETITPSPTITPTPSLTPTITPSPTPVYCCAFLDPVVGYTCGAASPPNQPNCPVNGVAFLNRQCTLPGQIGGVCAAFTPTFTVTNTKVTSTPTDTPTHTPTKTPTPTVTQTPTIGGFAIDPYSCYRVKASKSSDAKGMEFTVTDQSGSPQIKKIVKPKLICNPTNADFDDVPAIMNPVDHLTCYKIKDIPKVKSQKVTMRNELDEALVVDVIKGDLLCVPSYKTPPKANASPTPTPSAGVAPTNTP